jgi:hypothetical protein
MFQRSSSGARRLRRVVLHPLPPPGGGRHFEFSLEGPIER